MGARASDPTIQFVGGDNDPFPEKTLAPMVESAERAARESRAAPQEPAAAPPRAPLGETIQAAGYEYDAGMDEDVDHDAQLAEALDTMPGDQLAEMREYFQIGVPEAPPEEQKKPVSSFWQQLPGAVLRGGVRAVSEAGKTVVGAGVGLSKVTGAYKLGRTPEEEAEFLKWYEKPISEWNPVIEGTDIPLAIGEERIQKWMGPKASGAAGFVESATQAVVGMVTATKLLKAGGILQGAGKAAMVGKGLVAGGITDAAFFDPHEARLSDWVEGSAPSWAKNSVTEYLKADPKDSDAEGRLKNALEGALLGGVLEGAVYLFKRMRAKKALEEGAITEAEFAKVDQEVREGIEKLDDASGEYVQIRDTPEGGVEIAPKISLSPPPGSAVDAAKKSMKDEGLLPEAPVSKPSNEANTVAPPGRPPLGAPPSPSRAANVLKFPSRAAAEPVAATVDFALRNAAIIPGKLSDEQLVAFLKAKTKYAANGDPRQWDELLKQYGFNVKYADVPENVIDTIKAMADAMPDGLKAARGAPESFELWTKQAKELLPHLDGDMVVKRAQEVWGSMVDMPKYITALRTWVYAQGRQVDKLSQQVLASADNVIALDELRKALTTLQEVQAYVAGTGTAAGRTLKAHQLDVGGLADGVAKGADEAADGAKAVADAGHRAPSNAGVFAQMSREEILRLTRALAYAGGDPEVISKLISGPQYGAVVAGAGKAAGKKGTQAAGAAIQPAGTEALTKTQQFMASMQALKKKWFDYVNSFRMEAMLSGPKTHITNAIGNAMVMFQQPVEMLWAGVLSRNKSMAQKGADALQALVYTPRPDGHIMAGLFLNLRDSFAMASKAFMSGENILDPQNLITGKSVGSIPSSADPMAWLKVILKLPSRMLMTSDEFFKQMNYRAHSQAQVLQAARASGLTGKALAQRIESDLINKASQVFFDPKNGAVNGVGLQYSKVATFTNDLDYGWGKRFQEWHQESDLFKLIMPFVRTPVNIFRYAWQRTPVLNRFQAQHMADIAAGGERAAMASARSTMGAAMYGMATMLAMNGTITGKGPSDPELRRQWKEAGFQPYSVRVGDRWVSFRRGDPVFTALGMAADMATMVGEMDVKQRQNYAAAVIASISSNMMSKTFMQGMVEFLDAAGSGREDLVEKFATNVVGSFVPNILRQMNGDQAIHETRSMMDEVMARIPGLSDTLEPRRNILGEKVLRPAAFGNDAINPFTISDPDKLDNVQVELIELGKAFTMPAEEIEGGLIKLTDRDLYDNGTRQSPYDRMLQLMAEPKNGKSLRQELTELVKKKPWKDGKLSDWDAEGPGGMKHKLVQDRIQGARERAFAQVRREYPKLKEALRQADKVRATGAARGDEGMKQVLGKVEKLFIQPRLKQ